jgi:putative MATE family efflux protein
LRRTPRPAPTLSLRPIAAPLAAELGLGMAVGIAATALAARVSDPAAAAFALAHQVVAMLFIFFRIVGAGVSVVTAQALGAGRRDDADAVARASLAASSWVGLSVAVIAAAGAGPLLRILNAPAEVLPLAVPLLRLMAPVMLLDAWNACAAGVVRAHLHARDAMLVVLAMHLVHLALALWWMPLAGLPGFAAALAVSRLLGVALNLQLWRWRLQLTPRWADLWRWRGPALSGVLRIGVPGAAENIAYRLSFVVSVAAVGRMGAQALATQAYVLQITQVTLLFGLATGLACEIVVGRQIGAGRLRDAHRLVKTALARGLAVSVAAATVAALAGPRLLGAFSADAAIVAQGAWLLWCTVLVEPGRTFNLVVINALRAAGDVRYPVAVGAVSMAVVLAGGSWLLGHALGLGLPGVWLAYAADEWLRGLLMWRRWRRLRWVPTARRSRRRLPAGQSARAP